MVRFGGFDTAILGLEGRCRDLPPQPQSRTLTQPPETGALMKRDTPLAFLERPQKAPTILCLMWDKRGRRLGPISPSAAFSYLTRMDYRSGPYRSSWCTVRIWVANTAASVVGRSQIRFSHT